MIILVLVLMSTSVLHGQDWGEETPLSINKRLKVVGRELQNYKGYHIQLRGMSTHGLQWFSHCITNKSLDVMKDWGVDIVRVSMYVREGGYKTNPDKYVAIVDDLVDKIGDRGMYCIIDWHMLNPGDPNIDIDLAKVFFEEMSNKHGHKEHVIFEICNEPNGGAVTWSRIKEYANVIIPIIRSNAPKSIVIVGTPRWASTPDAVIGSELKFDNIMYTMHFYAADHTDEYQLRLKRAVNYNIPVFVTEFGTQNAAGEGANDFGSSQKWLDLLAKYKISWVNWNFSDDHRSGAVWKTQNACWSENWDDSNLKEAGKWIKRRISNPPDDFGKDNIMFKSGALGSQYMKVHQSPLTKNISISFPKNGGYKNVDLVVYTPNGQIIKKISVVDHKGNIQWNGTTNNGNTLTKGFYFIRARINNEMIVVKKIMKL